MVRRQWKTARARSHWLLNPRALIISKISEEGFGRSKRGRRIWSKSKVGLE